MCAPPYDVVDTAEARELAHDNPDSFFHVSRPDIDLPDDVGDVYQQGLAGLRDLIARDVLRLDDAASLFVYRASGTLPGIGDVAQTGVLCCTSVAEYENATIATHEFTRPDKELDRVRHVDTLDAHDEPVFLMHRPAPAIDDLVAVATAEVPVEQVTAQDGTRHTLWRVSDPRLATNLSDAFAALPRLYVADGHHRSAAAARVAVLRREAGTAKAESESFLSVVFPGEQLSVLPYFRVATLAGAPSALLSGLDAAFDVRPSATPVVPQERHHFGMYLAGRWYELRSHDGLVEERDAIARLDVSLLQDHVLAPLLGIEDPRRDPRLRFVGGIRGTGALEDLAGPGGGAVAFTLFPTTAGEVMDVADLGLVMPPKSTWFEPKLLSGLVVHPITPGQASTER